MEKNSPPPDPQRQLREVVNKTAVGLVATGFEAIDQTAEVAKDWLKKKLIEGISGRPLK